MARDQSGGARGWRRGGTAGGTHGGVASRRARFIERNIPNFEILNEEALEIIEANAETVLEEIGVDFRRQPRRAGALARRRRRCAAANGCVSRAGWRASCAPPRRRSFTQHARNPERNVEIGGAILVLAPVYGPPFVRDADGGRRYATIADFRNFVKLGYMSKWLHHSGGTVCEPTDVPVNKRHLDMLLAHMTLSDKPFMGSVTEPSRAPRFGRDVRRSCSARTSSTRTR